MPRPLKLAEGAEGGLADVLLPTILNPEVLEPVLTAASIKKALALAEKYSLKRVVQATRTLEPALTYKTSANGHAAGDVRRPEYEQENVQIAIVGERFAVVGTWHDGVFESALIGGAERITGRPMTTLLKGSTTMMTEIARCAEVEIQIEIESRPLI